MGNPNPAGLHKVGRPRKAILTVKQSLYFPTKHIEEIQREANRLDRSLSWVVQRAWKIARKRISEFPKRPLDLEE